MKNRCRIAVIGLGYVGLPVAAAFARGGHDVIGFDIDRQRIAELRSGVDRTRETPREDIDRANLLLTSHPDDLRAARIFIVAAPTPIDAARRPELSALLQASRTVGAALKRGDIVIYESTVYPGATEQECGPALEQASGLRCGQDFTLAYSPERINPGDPEHRFETIRKVVAAQDQATLDTVAELYASVVSAGIHRAPSIKTAEAAKVIENTQRDLNIALMNELSAIFHRLGIDTADVLEAAGTKWNFLPFTPGLVGGHCIGVDPYYLTHCAELAGHQPEVILAGRRINDAVGRRVARQCVRMLMRGPQFLPCVTILGFAFKENIPDIRNTKVLDVVRELQSFSIEVQVHDPVARSADAEAAYGVTLTPQAALKSAGAVILAVPHREFVDAGWPLITSLLRNGEGPVLDLRSKLPRGARPAGVELWRL